MPRAARCWRMALKGRIPTRPDRILRGSWSLGQPAKVRALGNLLPVFDRASIFLPWRNGSPALAFLELILSVNSLVVQFMRAYEKTRRRTTDRAESPTFIA
jgi:hypothetical protein